MTTLTRWLGRMAMKTMQKALPAMGETEQAALEAGRVGFEGELFAGQPDFDALLARGANALSTVNRPSWTGRCAPSTPCSTSSRSTRRVTCRPRSGSSCASAGSSA